jgi:hypothetical protein
MTHQPAEPPSAPRTGPAAAARRSPRVDPGEGWPASPLAALGRAFEVLVAPPAPYVIDGVEVSGWPSGPVPAGRVRGLLLSRRTAPVVRDAVWRELVVRARRPASEGQVWTVIAAGVALPGLMAAAGALCRGWQGETADIDAEVLAGFVARLKTLDVSGPRVVSRLIDAGIRAGRRARAQAGDRDTVPVDEAWSCPPVQPWDHPDWVLVRAVRAGVLDRTEARLIGATRLESATLAQAAAALGVDAELAADWRRRAEVRLAAAVSAGELDAVRVLAPRALRERRQAARLALVKAERARRRRVAAGEVVPGRGVVLS